MSADPAKLYTHPASHSEHPLYTPKAPKVRVSMTDIERFLHEIAEDYLLVRYEPEVKKP